MIAIVTVIVMEAAIATEAATEGVEVVVAMNATNVANEDTLPATADTDEAQAETGLIVIEAETEAVIVVVTEAMVVDEAVIDVIHVVIQDETREVCREVLQEVTLSTQSIRDVTVDHQPAVNPHTIRDREQDRQRDVLHDHQETVDRQRTAVLTATLQEARQKVAPVVAPEVAPEEADHQVTGKTVQMATQMDTPMEVSRWTTVTTNKFSSYY